MTLQELLDDASVSSELEINLGDKGKFKLSDLRDADRSRKDKLTAEDGRLKAAMADVVKKQQELTALAADAATLMEKLRAEPPVKAKGGDDDIDFESDPIYGPLMKKILKPIQAKQSEIAAAMDGINRAVTDIGRIGLVDRYSARWAAVPADKRPKDKGWKDYVKLAQDRSIFDEVGLPDPVAALERELAPSEAAAMQKRLDALQTENDMLKKQAPRMPRPGSPGVPAKAGKDAKAFESVEDLVDTAFNDPMIQEIAGNA